MDLSTFSVIHLSVLLLFILFLFSFWTCFFDVLIFA